MLPTFLQQKATLGNAKLNDDPKMHVQNATSQKKLTGANLLGTGTGGGAGATVGDLTDGDSSVLLNLCGERGAPDDLPTEPLLMRR